MIAEKQPQKQNQELNSIEWYIKKLIEEENLNKAYDKLSNLHEDERAKVTKDIIEECISRGKKEKHESEFLFNFGIKIAVGFLQQEEKIKALEGIIKASLEEEKPNIALNAIKHLPKERAEQQLKNTLKKCIEVGNLNYIENRVIPDFPESKKLLKELIEEEVKSQNNELILFHVINISKKLLSEEERIKLIEELIKKLLEKESFDTSIEGAMVLPEPQKSKMLEKIIGRIVEKWIRTKDDGWVNYAIGFLIELPKEEIKKEWEKIKKILPEPQKSKMLKEIIEKIVEKGIRTKDYEWIYFATEFLKELPKEEREKELETIEKMIDKAKNKDEGLIEVEREVKKRVFNIREEKQKG
jgi:ferritin